MFRACLGFLPAIFLAAALHVGNSGTASGQDACTFTDRLASLGPPSLTCTTVEVSATEVA